MKWKKICEKIIKINFLKIKFTVIFSFFSFSVEIFENYWKFFFFDFFEIFVEKIWFWNKKFRKFLKIFLIMKNFLKISRSGLATVWLKTLGNIQKPFFSRFSFQKPFRPLQFQKDFSFRKTWNFGWIVFRPLLGHTPNSVIPNPTFAFKWDFGIKPVSFIHNSIIIAAAIFITRFRFTISQHIWRWAILSLYSTV